MKNQYILIIGIGRSGTNWLFDLLNLSKKSYCRNATYNAVPDSLLAPLITGLSPLKGDQELSNKWDEAIDMMSTKIGALDGTTHVNKEYYKQWAQSIGLIRLFGNYKLRKTISQVLPSFDEQEWYMPDWLINSTAFAEKTTVLRIGESVSCPEWVLENKPNARFIHMVRHPGGFLKSWKKRYLSQNNENKVLHDNIVRLEQSIQINPEWSDLIGDLNALSVEESELWFWRYSTEMIWRTGQNKEQYQLITFEKLATELQTILEQVYQHCDLPLTSDIINASTIMASRFSGKKVCANEIANKWRDELNSKDIDSIEKVLLGSPLLSFWEEP